MVVFGKHTTPLTLLVAAVAAATLLAPTRALSKEDGCEDLTMRGINNSALWDAKAFGSVEIGPGNTTAFADGEWVGIAGGHSVNTDSVSETVTGTAIRIGPVNPALPRWFEMDASNSTWHYSVTFWMYRTSSTTATLYAVPFDRENYQDPTDLPSFYLDDSFVLTDLPLLNTESFLIELGAIGVENAYTVRTGSFRIRRGASGTEYMTEYPGWSTTDPVVDPTELSLVVSKSGDYEVCIWIIDRARSTYWIIIATSTAAGVFLLLMFALIYAQYSQKEKQDEKIAKVQWGNLEYGPGRSTPSQG